MKYSIKVNEVKNGSENTRGLATVTLGDSFKLNNIAIMNDPREENKVFVSMPSYKTNQTDEKGEPVYKDVFNPVTKEFRDELYDNILKAYHELHDVQAKNSYTVEYNAKDTKMPEFTVRVTPFEKDGSTIKGLASINFADGVAVNNVSIHQGKDSLFVSMPSYKTSKVDAQGKAVYKDIAHPITAKFRDKLYGEILQEYELVKANEQTAEKSSVKEKLGKNKEAVEQKDKADKGKVKENDQPNRDER